MRRRSGRLRGVLAWTALGLVPLLLCLALAYGLSLHHFRSETQSLAEAQARRIADILGSGAALLQDLARQTGAECSPDTIAAMNQVVFHSVHFREAGIERDGNLVCTSLEMLPPDFDIPNATRTPAARVDGIEILSPTKTIRGGQSLILNRPQDERRRAFVNLLLDPQQLVDGARYADGLHAATVLDDRPNGQVFRFDARGEAVPLPELPEPPLPGIHHREGAVMALARAEPYPFLALVAVDAARVRAYWLTQMQPAAIAGFLLSGLAFLALRRYLPRDDAVRDLREGIEADEIVLDYQPILDADSGRVLGAEALARWRHPVRGIVMPDEFIPLAEAAGLTQALTERVLARVQCDLRLLEPMPPGFRISINLARAQLADRSLLDSLDRLFGPDARLDRLGFEITERELLANVAEHARIVVQELVRRGAEVSLDDFGTGYSGLSHLRHLPLHKIKIDRSFVRALDTEAVTASLVGSIVALARTLGLELVAEGVETDSQRARLLALDVRQHQGWLYARAMRLRDLLQRLRAGGETAAAPTPPAPRA